MERTFCQANLLGVYVHFFQLMKGMTEIKTISALHPHVQGVPYALETTNMLHAGIVSAKVRGLKWGKIACCALRQQLLY